MRVYIDVTGPDGKVTNWNMELTSPNTIRRQGWGPDDLKAGDKVIFEGFGGKVVESRGSLQTIMKVSDMKPLFGPGGPDAAQASAVGVIVISRHAISASSHWGSCAGWASTLPAGQAPAAGARPRPDLRSGLQEHPGPQGDSGRSVHGRDGDVFLVARL